MTEKSYFWGGTSVGDATLAPYDDDEFSDFIVNAIQYRREVQGVIFGKDNNLEITNPSGLTIQVDTGRAYVDGKLYVNDVAVSLTLSAAPGSGTDYYHVVLRKAFSAQTVRAVLVGPVNGGPATPAVQIDGTTWDIVMAEVRQTSGGTISIINKQVPFNKAGAIQRLAGVDYASLYYTFSDIPSFRHLRIEGRLVGGAGFSVTAPNISIQFNGDTGANYQDNLWRFTSSTTAILTGTARDSVRVGRMDCVNPNAVTYIQIDIFQDPLGYASVVSEGNNGLTREWFKGMGTWLDVDPITSIVIFEDSELEWTNDMYDWTISVIE